MTSLGSVLNLASGGLHAQSAGIEVTSENINGANLPGYVRRNARLEAQLRTKGVAGGVFYAGTARAFDKLIFRQLTRETGLLGEADARSAALTEAEAAVAPGEGGTIADRISELLTAFGDLALKADDPAARSVVVAKTQAVASSFNDAAAQLAEQRSALLSRADGVATEVNQRLEQIAALNRRIMANPQPQGSRAELMDQRDELVRQVSERIGLSPVYDDKGSVTLLSSGAALVDGGQAARLAVDQDNTGKLRIRVTKGGSSTDVTANVDSGSLGGIREARDVTLASLSGELDQYASDFAAQINGVHAGGVGLDGVGGRPLFTDVNGGPVPPPPGTAYALSVNPLIEGNHDAVVAASSPGDLPGGNDVALAIAQLVDVPMASGKTAAEGFAVIAGHVGNAVAQAEADASMRQSTVAHAETTRQSTSGVSLDEEMVSLTRFQRAYEANLRVLTTTNEMLQELVQLR